MSEEALLLMQSSGAVAGRALIMLVCVVSMPALALSGASWSDIVKKLQAFHWPTRSESGAMSATAPLGEAPQFTPLSPTDARNPEHWIPAAAITQAPVQSSVISAGYQSPTDPATSTAREVFTVAETAVGTPPSADSFDAVQDRLRMLGATYYLLESWGNDRQMYRFFCKMAIGGSADYTRCFEATHSDPLLAMTGVLRQVETWRGGVPDDRQMAKN